MFNRDKPDLYQELAQAVSELKQKRPELFYPRWHIVGDSYTVASYSGTATTFIVNVDDISGGYFGVVYK